MTISCLPCCAWARGHGRVQLITVQYGREGSEIARRDWMRRACLIDPRDVDLPLVPGAMTGTVPLAGRRWHGSVLSRIHMEQEKKAEEKKKKRKRKKRHGPSLARHKARDLIHEAPCHPGSKAGREDPHRKEAEWKGRKKGPRTIKNQLGAGLRRGRSRSLGHATAPGGPSEDGWMGKKAAAGLPGREKPLRVTWDMVV